MKRLSRAVVNQTIHIRSLDVERDFEEFLRYKPYFTYVYLDLRCSESENLLRVVAHQKLLNATRHFILFGDNLNNSLAKLRTQDFRVDSKVLLILEMSKSFQILEVTKDLEVMEIGQYRNKILNFYKKPFRVVDLNETILPICTYVYVIFDPLRTFLNSKLFRFPKILEEKSS